MAKCNRRFVGIDVDLHYRFKVFCTKEGVLIADGLRFILERFLAGLPVTQVGFREHFRDVLPVGGQERNEERGNYGLLPPPAAIVINEMNIAADEFYDDVVAERTVVPLEPAPEGEI